jgi:hypothetical protein
VFTQTFAVVIEPDSYIVNLHLLTISIANIFRVYKMPLQNFARVINTERSGYSNRYRTVVEELVEMATTNDISYESGSPRKHHSLHFSSGDIVIQVSNS